MKKHCLLIVFLIPWLTFFIVNPAFGQGEIKPVTVISPSPVASSLLKDINVPVNYYTGTPQISIPLYSVKIGSIEMPITIKYTATGIKVEEDAGMLGLGWDLVAGGVIGRSIIGKPDERTLNDAKGAGYYNSATYFGMPEPENATAGSMHLWVDGLTGCNVNDLSQGKRFELTPDNYFMNFNGNGARLFFDKNKKPYFSPYKAWKLSGDVQNGFVVVTEDGTTYEFKLTESSFTSSETLPGDDAATTDGGPTSWYLTQIISSDKVDTLKITYQSANYSPTLYNPVETNSILTINQPTRPTGSMADCIPTPQTANLSKTSTVQTVNGYVMKSILTKNQRVDFFTNMNREDIPDFSHGMAYKMDSIIIIRLDGSKETQLKRFIFNYNYYQNSASNVLAQKPVSERLKLISLVETSALNDSSRVHHFTYYEDNPLPNKDSKSQDNWGYFNNKNNFTLIPSFELWNGADRSTDPAFANMGLLKQLQYPTGGFTSFEYEVNRRESQVTDSIIKLNTVGAATSLGKDFSSSTFTVPYSQVDTINYSYTSPVTGDNYAEIGIYNNTTNETIFYSGAGSQRGSVRVYLSGGTTYRLEATRFSSSASAAVNIRYFSHLPPPIDGVAIGGARIKRLTQSDGSTPVIRRFEYLNDDNTSSGKLLSQPIYSSMTYSPQFTCGNFPGKYGDWNYFTQHSVSTVALGRTQGSFVGYTQVKIFYGENGENGSEKLLYNFRPDVGSSNFPYAPKSSREDVRGLLLQRSTYRSDGKLLQKEENMYNFNDISGSPHFRTVYGFKTGCLKLGNVFSAGSCPFINSQGWQFVSEFYETYQIWPTIAATKQTTYNTNSNDSITFTTQITYDTTNLLPIAKQVMTSKGETFITNYKYPGNFPGVAVYDSMIARNILTPIIETDQYRNGNLITKMLTNYQFWNGNTQLIAPLNKQFQNRTNPIETRFQFYQYDKFGNVLEQSKDHDLHEVFLWGYNSQYPVAKIEGSDYNTVKQIVSQSILDNPATTDSDMRTELNKLRNSLPKALITTYTYSPLIGVTSQTDTRGMTTYSEYDGYNRLKLIRNKDQKIIKKFDYQYQQQP